MNNLKEMREMALKVNFAPIDNKPTVFNTVLAVRAIMCALLYIGDCLCRILEIMQEKS